jgi:DNA repair protein RadC
MNSYEQRQTIKAWAEDDRPREKLLLKGRQALSNAELVAILLGSGTREESAVDLGKRILKMVDNDLATLGRLGVSDLKKIKGIGDAKAISLISALELGVRRRGADVRQIPKITSSASAYEVLASKMADLTIEQFWIIYLDRANAIQQVECVSSGGISGTVVDPRMIFKRALELQSSAIIAGHNHPSGTPRPSDADNRLTQKIKAAGEILDIQLLDHLIVLSSSYFSYADSQLL